MQVLGNFRNALAQRYSLRVELGKTVLWGIKYQFEGHSMKKPLMPFYKNRKSTSQNIYLIEVILRLQALQQCGLLQTVLVRQYIADV